MTEIKPGPGVYGSVAILLDDDDLEVFANHIVRWKKQGKAQLCGNELWVSEDAEKRMRRTLEKENTNGY